MTGLTKLISQKSKECKQHTLSHGSFRARTPLSEDHWSSLSVHVLRHAITASLRSRDRVGKAQQLKTWWNSDQKMYETYFYFIWLLFHLEYFLLADFLGEKGRLKAIECFEWHWSNLPQCIWNSLLVGAQVVGFHEVLIADRWWFHLEYWRNVLI